MKIGRFVLLAALLVICPALRSAAQVDAESAGIPHPSVDVLYISPENYDKFVHARLVKGTEVNFSVTFLLFASPTDAIHFVGNLTINGKEPTINGKKSGPVEFRILPLAPPSSGGADGTQTWPVQITGPRNLFAEVHFMGIGYVSRQTFDFYDQKLQYEVTCNPKDFIVSRFFQKMFHRCY
jgi:hypothetical protein